MSFGGIVFSLPPKKRLRKNVASTSSRWCPSAIFVAPSSLATRYKTPRRKREHSEHIVRPAGMTRLTTLWVSCSAIWNGTPRSPRYRGNTSAGKPGCFWSRLTATMSKRSGARGRRDARAAVGIDVRHGGDATLSRHARRIQGGEAGRAFVGYHRDARRLAYTRRRRVGRFPEGI